MQRIRRILVPTDFSAHAARALDYAIDLAREVGASIDLIHCHHVSAGASCGYAPMMPVNVVAELRELAQRELSAWAARVEDHGVEVRGRLHDGLPWDGILDEAASSKADLIVMGTRGLAGLKHVLLGSVTERVVRSAPCPVLTLRDPDA